jgi:hypothetical protein
MSSKCLIAIGLLCIARTVLAQQPPPSLRTAASFAVLASTVTSSGATVVTGNLGGNAIHGFPPGHVLLGTTLSNGDIATPSHDAAAVYDDLRLRSCEHSLEGDTLPQGVYCSADPFTLEGTLTLDANHDPNAFWILQLPTGLTTAPDSAVRVINGGFEGNVFWQIEGKAVLGDGTVFIGNVLASKGITMGAGATLSGRALVLDGAATLSGNNVSLCCHNITIRSPIVTDATEALPFNESFTQEGAITPASFTLGSGVLPHGLTLHTDGTLSGTPTEMGTFTITVRATDATNCIGIGSTYVLTVGCPLITISPETLPPPRDEVPYSEILTVSGGTPPYTFEVTSGRLPAGLTLTPGPALTATISGTPAFTEPFVATITVTDAAGCVAIPAISHWELIALVVLLGGIGVAAHVGGGSLK